MPRVALDTLKLSWDFEEIAHSGGKIIFGIGAVERSCARVRTVERADISNMRQQHAPVSGIGMLYRWCCCVHAVKEGAYVRPSG
jgi:hypothetical protein